MELGNRPDLEALEFFVKEKRKKCHVQRRRRLEEGRRRSEPSEDNLSKANGKCSDAWGKKLTAARQLALLLICTKQAKGKGVVGASTNSNETSGPSQAESGTRSVLMLVFSLYCMRQYGLSSSMDGWTKASNEHIHIHTHTNKQRHTHTRTQ